MHTRSTFPNGCSCCQELENATLNCANRLAERAIYCCILAVQWFSGLVVSPLTALIVPFRAIEALLARESMAIFTY